MRLRRGSIGLPTIRAICWMLLFPALFGCRISVVRARTGQPLRLEEYEELEVGQARREEALEMLGAPDKVVWEDGKSRLSWEHLDTTFLEARLQVPITFFLYRHNLFRYFQNKDLANAMDLLFDDSGVLEQKSLRLPEAYKETPAAPAGWRLHVTPRFEHSFLVRGDADFEDYDELFKDGLLAGLELGVQPVAPVIVSAGGSYQIYQGDALTASDGSRLQFDDLELFSVEATLRVQVPLRIFASARNLQDAWDLFLQADPAGHDGWVFFVEGGLGITANGNVPVWENGVRQGNFFDDGPGLATSASTGFEWSWKHLSLRAGITYRATDGFNEGNTSLPSQDAASFQTLGGMASLAVKF